MQEENQKKIVTLFSKNISIKGKHGQYMKALVSKFDSELPQGMFKRNLDVYLIAPIIGKLYNRKADEEQTTEDTSIHAEQLNEEMDRLLFNYRLIVFLEGRNKVEFDERCNRAFRYDKNMEKRAYGDEIFNSYVLGGIEFMYEKLIEEAKDADDFTANMYNCINDYSELFANSIIQEELYDLCKLAGN